MLSHVPPSPSSAVNHTRPLAGLGMPSRPSDALALLSPVVVTGLVRFLDFAVATLTGFALAILYVGASDVTADLLYGTVIAIAALAAVIALDLLGLYSTRALAAFPLNLPRLMLGWASALAFAGMFVFFIKAGAELSRVWLAVWLLAGGLALAFERGAVRFVLGKLHSSGHLVRRAVIYGAGALTDDLIHMLEADHGSEIRIVSVFDERRGGRGAPSMSESVRAGALDDLVDVARTLRVDLVIVSLPLAG